MRRREERREKRGNVDGTRLLQEQLESRSEREREQEQMCHDQENVRKTAIHDEA